MRKPSALRLVALACLSGSCGDSRVKLPIQTSLGDLIRVEAKDNVATDERTFSPESGGVLYVLSFEGKGQFDYQESEIKDTTVFLPLIDSGGKEFRHVFMGTPMTDGTLSNKAWKYSGELVGRDGRFVFVGKLSLPEPTLTLLYSVPKTASGLALKDGDQKHRIN